METRARLAPLTHQPALDGIRGLAIVAVLVFHLGYADAGFLGVDLFFVLSGFLITRILLTRLDGDATVGLRSFWAGRARRLLPAALVTVTAVGLLGAVGVFASPTLRGDLGAALGYVANWRLVLTGDDYADQFGPASPVRHVWSLAVEEQFYLVWPLVLGGAAWWAARRGWRLTRVAFAVATALAAVSVVLLWRWFDPAGVSRAYYGTDSRMFGPLIGAALAVVTARRTPTARPWRPLELGAFVVATAAGLAVVARWRVTSEAYYHGGAALFALGCAGLVAVALVRPLPPLRWGPLVWIGTVSYGLYLYHWPIFALLTPARTGWSDPWLAGARLAVTVAVAAASAAWLERPIRAGRLPAGVPARYGVAALVGGAAMAVLAVAVVPVPEPLVDLTTSIDLAAPPPGGPAPTDPDPSVAAAPGATAGPAGFSLDASALAALAVAGTTPAGSPPATDPASGTGAPTPSTTIPPGPLRVMVVGDSVGDNVGAGLERWAAGRDDLVVWNRALVGCGFELDAEVVDGKAARADCRTWRAGFRSYTEQFAPDVVLVVVGRGDQQRRTKADWSGPQRLGDPGFDELMRAAYDEALADLRRPGTEVVLATYPCLDEIWNFGGRPTPDGRMANEVNARWNDFLRGLGPPVVDLDGRVCPGGQFQQQVEGVEAGRPDGIHFSAEAADALAPWLVEELRRRVPGR